MLKELNNSNESQPKSYGIVIEDDPKQVAFSEAVEDWVQGKTSYDTVVERIPGRTQSFGEAVKGLFHLD